MTKQEAARLFQILLLSYGAELSPRDPDWLDYSDPKNVFTRDLETQCLSSPTRKSATKGD